MHLIFETTDIVSQKIFDNGLFIGLVIECYELLTTTVFF